MSSSAVPQRGRLSNVFHSVRFRLSLWFALVLAIILLVFSGFVYYRQAVDVQQRAETRLNERLREVDLALRRSLLLDPNARVWPPLQVIPPESQLVTQETDLIVVIDSLEGISGASDWLEQAQIDSITASAPRSTSRQFFYADQVGPDHQTISRYVFLSSPLGFNDRLLGWVILGQPLDDLNLLPRLAWTLIGASLVLLLAAVAGGFLLADRALRPVKLITHTARQISETDLSRRLNIHTRDELGELAGTFDQMLERLEAGFNRQKQFTADASHELRTPMTIIGLEAGRTLENNLPPNVEQSLRVIRSENEFMTRLVEELLTLARMDSGQVNLKLERLDLSEVAADVLERYAPVADRKKVRLEAGDLPEVWVQGDRSYLMQLLSNLVDNAIKYSPPQEGQWVRLETGLDGKTAWARVSDNGPGIDPQHLAHIFDRFYRVDDARSHNPQEEDASGEIPGSGLGLSIVQRIAQAHQGVVSVHSDTGQGSLFEVKLPAL